MFQILYVAFAVQIECTDIIDWYYMEKFYKSQSENIGNCIFLVVSYLYGGFLAFQHYFTL